MTDVSSNPAGQGLSFRVSGPGVTIDAATGLLAIPGAALAAGIEVVVGAGEAAGSRFRLSLLPAEENPVRTAPELAAAPVLRGTGTIGSPVEADPGQWTGIPAPEVTLQWRADGTPIPGATGAGFVPTAAEDERDLDCLVTATNAAGTATAVAGPIRVAEAAPAVTGAIADVLLVQGAPAGRVEAAAHFAGQGLRFSVAGAGAALGDGDDATGTILLPTGVLLAEEPVVVTARNSGGAATVVFRVSVTAAPVLPAAPVARGVLPDLVLEQGTGERTVSAQAGFDGEELAFELAAAPTGVTIESGSGLVRIPTDQAIEAARITVRAGNAAGTAEQGFAVTVQAVAPATTSDFTSPEALVDFQPLYYTAPSWTQAAGFAQLVPAAKARVHGNWTKASEDGLYRCLARWSASKTSASGARPFSFNARLSKAKSGWQGILISALQSSAKTRELEITEYVTGTTTMTALTTTAVSWEWNDWYWIEVEVNGPLVRARLYPELAAAPDWQVSATTSFTTPGAFGPGSFPLSTGGPSIDIRRLEFAPLIRGSESVPPAAQAADWSLGQFTESKK